MSEQYKAHTFVHDDTWEPLDSYWSSPLSYWSRKSLRIEPLVPLRVRMLGKIVAESVVGWINYGGLGAMFVHVVEAKGRAGQRVRAVISDEPVHEVEA